MSSPATRGFALTATMKLSTRITDNVDRIRSIVSIYGSCIDVELQQRAVEYNALFKKYDHMRAAVLERMPVIEKNSPGHTNGESAGEAIKEIQPAKVKQAEPLLPQQPANQVCDLLDLLGGSEEPLQPSPAQSSTAPGLPINTASSAGGDLLDLLGGLEPTPTAPVTVYDKGGVTLTLSCEKQSDTGLTVTLTASNSTDSDISGFTLQAAVPKSVQLHMKAPSGDFLPARGAAKVIQMVVLNNPNKVNLKMRIRISHSSQGSAFQDTYFFYKVWNNSCQNKNPLSSRVFFLPATPVDCIRNVLLHYYYVYMASVCEYEPLVQLPPDSTPCIHQLKVISHFFFICLYLHL
uniref:Adaptor related protein complex 1 subunit gamma 2 n=1 Tax=Seriola dumerili TaxID=41447 RepID=A0A3B4UCI9_SERDU